jgi:enamine deaminase RidA (YjgF/YER057c/UK114 family)
MGDTVRDGYVDVDRRSVRREDKRTLAAETTQCVRNLAAVCEAGGTDIGQAVRMTIDTRDLGAFAEIDDAYARVEIDAAVAVS